MSGKLRLKRVELVGDEHDHHVWQWNWHYTITLASRPWIKIWGCRPAGRLALKDSAHDR